MKAWGAAHTINSLGNHDADQGELDEAEKVYRRKDTRIHLIERMSYNIDA